MKLSLILYVQNEGDSSSKIKRTITTDEFLKEKSKKNAIETTVEDDPDQSLDIDSEEEDYPIKQ